MATFPAPDPIQSTFFIPGSNTPGNGVQVFFYTNLTSTKTTVYKDSGTTTAWTNPIVLDSGGNLPSGGQVYINSGETLTVKYAPANDSDPPVSVYRTLNDIEGINDISVTVATNEWTTGGTPTFISATSFSLVGNQTAIFTVGRRVKTTNTGGTVYSTIVSSVFGAVTTVTVVNDSGVIDSGISAVEYGLLASINPSIPVQRDNIFRLADNSDPTKLLAFQLSGLTTGTTRTITMPDADITLAQYAIKAKPADQSITTTALTNDSDLFFPIGSNEQWLANFYIAAAAQLSSATGVQVAVTSPASSSIMTNASLAGALLGDASRISIASGIALQWTSTVVGEASSKLLITVWVANSSNAGNVQLQFAQTNTTTTPVTFLKGSSLTAQRIA
jgi:hypothetical protein